MEISTAQQINCFEGSIVLVDTGLKLNIPDSCITCTGPEKQAFVFKEICDAKVARATLEDMSQNTLRELRNAGEEVSQEDKKGIVHVTIKKLTNETKAQLVEIFSPLNGEVIMKVWKYEKN